MINSSTVKLRTSRFIMFCTGDTRALLEKTTYDDDVDCEADITG
jgi:hypothetical protein